MMKHISEFLIPRMRRMERERQLTLFSAPRENGMREWRTFDTVEGDSVNAYRVRTPRKAVVIAQKNHVLRIAYPQVRALGGM